MSRFETWLEVRFGWKSCHAVCFCHHCCLIQVIPLKTKNIYILNIQLRKSRIVGRWIFGQKQTCVLFCRNIPPFDVGSPADDLTVGSGNEENLILSRIFGRRQVNLGKSAQLQIQLLQMLQFTLFVTVHCPMSNAHCPGLTKGIPERKC